jgi:hypothetical protein
MFDCSSFNKTLFRYVIYEGYWFHCQTTLVLGSPDWQYRRRTLGRVNNRLRMVWRACKRRTDFWSLLISTMGMVNFVPGRNFGRITRGNEPFRIYRSSVLLGAWGQLGREFKNNPHPAPSGTQLVELSNRHRKGRLIESKMLTDKFTANWLVKMIAGQLSLL